MDTFQDRLKSERNRLGLSQEAFGELGGVAKMTQYFYESGRTWPTCEYLDELRKNNVDVSFIVSGQRTLDDGLDWELLKKSFLFVHQSFGSGKAQSTPEELFEAFQMVLEAAMKIKQKERTVLSEASKTAI